MYTLTQDQEKEINSFIGKLPDSIVKSKVVNWFEEIKPTKRVTSEQLEKFLSFQNALPASLQTYPQVIAQWFKNEPATAKREVAEGTPKNQKADFKGMVADSHAHVKREKIAGDKGVQKQEILHTLNVTDKTLAGTKAEPKEAVAKPSYEETLKSEAAESAKTSGGKPVDQKKEEERIISANKAVDEPKPKTEKPKEVVIIEKKKK